MSARIPLQACSLFKYTEENSFEAQGRVLAGGEGEESFLNVRNSTVELLAAGQH